jgi:hypothetical protein
LNQGASPRTGMNVSSSLPHDSLAASFHSSACDVSQAITWKGLHSPGKRKRHMGIHTLLTGGSLNSFFLLRSFFSFSQSQLN